MGDKSRALDMLQDKAFMEYSDSGQLSESAALSRFNQLVSYGKGGIGKYAIVYKPSNEVIGYCGVEPFVLKDKTEFELGYRLISSYRGLGIATEAANAVVAQTDKPLYAYVNRDNIGSINVLHKAGFINVGQYNLAGKQYELFRHM